MSGEEVALPSFRETLCNPEGLVADPTISPAPFKQARIEPEIVVKEPTVARELFKNGKFTEAILVTTEQIRAADDSTPTEHILHLWYIRIQCLLILQLGHQAAEEIGNNLQPLESDEFKEQVLVTSDARLSAWKLSLLLVPVKTKGINQSAVQSYYALGIEARHEALRFEDKQSEWLSAVEVSGLYALSTLIVLRDYMTAINLLRTHFNATKDPELARLLALLHIMLGDTLGAQAWTSRLPAKLESDKTELEHLISFGDRSTMPEQRDAMSDVYNGHISRAIDLLESRAINSRTKSGQVVNVNLSNLFVLYSLCFADPKQPFQKLAEKLRIAGNLDLESTELSAAFARAL